MLSRTLRQTEFQGPNTTTLAIMAMGACAVLLPIPSINCEILLDISCRQGNCFRNINTPRVYRAFHHGKYEEAEAYIPFAMCFGKHWQKNKPRCWYSPTWHLTSQFINCHPLCVSKNRDETMLDFLPSEVNHLLNTHLISDTRLSGQTPAR